MSAGAIFILICNVGSISIIFASLLIRNMLRSRRESKRQRQIRQDEERHRELRRNMTELIQQVIDLKVDNDKLSAAIAHNTASIGLLHSKIVELRGGEGENRPIRNLELED